ncbi:hypothetical protein C4K39_4825 [Pseudomonas sessilinigenes]|nr:hypothetical protein C4K39_4825 [Pseudomonas sessilinigenes]
MQTPLGCAGQAAGAPLKRRGSIPRLGAGHTRQAGKRKSPIGWASFLRETPVTARSTTENLNSHFPGAALKWRMAGGVGNS